MNPKYILMASLALAAFGCRSKSETAITYDTATRTAPADPTQQPPLQPGAMINQQQAAAQAQAAQQMQQSGDAAQPPQNQIGTTGDKDVASKLPPMPKSTPSPEQYQTAPPKLPSASALTRHGDTIISPTGLKYIDLKVGEGPDPVVGDFVSVKYVGMLTDGKEFDRNDSFTTQIGVGSVIPGWDEGVLTMKKGGKRRLIIPGKLGARAVAKHDVIPLNRTIIYDVEVMLIQK